MLSKEEIENLDYRNMYLQDPISILTKENLDRLEEHCKKTIHFERGIEHSVTLELLYKYKELESDKQKLIEKLEEDVENFKKQNADATLQDYSQEILSFLKGENNG